MKKQILFVLFSVSSILVYAQENISLLRHDTTVLKADECHWLVDKAGANGKSVSLAILEAIQSGKLKAYDPQTNESIPSDKILTWRQSSDTTMVWDPAKEKDVIKVIQKKIDPENLTRIKVYHDWYLYTTTGKLESRLKMFEMMAEVRTAYSGDLIGYLPFCLIRY